MTPAHRLKPPLQSMLVKMQCRLYWKGKEKQNMKNITTMSLRSETSSGEAGSRGSPLGSNGIEHNQKANEIRKLTTIIRAACGISRHNVPCLRVASASSKARFQARSYEPTAHKCAKDESPELEAPLWTECATGRRETNSQDHTRIEVSHPVPRADEEKNNANIIR